MKISKKITEKIKKEPVLFAELLIELNNTDEVLPATLLQRLERESRLVRENITVVTFLKNAGYTNEQIFEQYEK